MNKITQLRQMLAFLPEKDIELANKFLDKHDFVRLKELVDSDVIKLGRKITNEISKFVDEHGEDGDYIATELDEQFNVLRNLQMEVDIQAAAFMDEPENPYD